MSKVKMRFTEEKIVTKICKVVRQVSVPSWVMGGRLCELCGFEFEDHDLDAVIFQIENDHDNYYSHSDCLNERFAKK